MRDILEDLFAPQTAAMTQLLGKAAEAREAGASRREFFAKTAAIAGAGLVGGALMRPIAAQAAAMPADTASGETATTILTLAATAEALATTFYYFALQSSALKTVNNNANRNYFQAALSQEYIHLFILDKMGVAPLQTSFHFPDGMFTDEKTFFATASVLEDYFISAYIAAAREFSGAVSSGLTIANPTAIGLAVQIAGIECEHRALLRVAANENPANNVLIESALIGRVSDAVKPLTPFLKGGDGFSYKMDMPGIAAIKSVSAPYDPASFPAIKIF